MSKLYLDSIYVLDSIKGAVDYERLLLKPDLEINCNVRVQVINRDSGLDNKFSERCFYRLTFVSFGIFATSSRASLTN